MKVTLNDVLDEVDISEAYKDKIREIFNGTLAEQTQELASISTRFVQERAEQIAAEKEEKLIKLCKHTCEELLKEKIDSDTDFIIDEIIRKAKGVIYS